MNEAVKVAVQLQYDRLRDEAQSENEDFLNKLDENIQKIIKEQVKEQVSKILPKIEKTINEQLKAEVLTRSSNSSKTSYDVAVDLSELELKKILIEKIKSNKSINRSDEQRNLYKALVDAYECDKIILDTYGDTVMLKRHRDDEDKDEEPSVGLDRGSKRRRACKEPESTIALKEKASKTFGKSTEGSKSHQKTTSTSTPAEEPIDLAKQADSRTSFNELMDTLVDFSAFLMNRLKVDTLTPELLVGPTYELMKGRRVIPFDHFINNDLEYLRGGASSRKYTISVTKTNTADYGHIKWIEDLFYGFAVNRESVRDVYFKRRIIAVTELQIVERHNYKHLDWITVRTDDDKLYKFKEGSFKRLCIQDIEDMLLLLVQEKLTNLTVDERFAFNVSLRMFTRSIVIQRRVEDLQLGVESYQKKLNLTKPDTYRTDLKRKKAYTAYSNPRGFIYQNIDKQNRLMRIDELHKFSDSTLNDVRTTLDDCLNGIRMKYLPQTIRRRSDKERAATMIQVIDNQLKTKKIM
nr:putative ribonuclease H-like domain-containing protein [Tanacetum cinerariifolium]